jgi:quercetin dioxygenase-like cupin family protein
MTLLNLDEIHEYELAPGIRARIINTESMSVSYVNLDAGADMPEHSHINEQIVSLIEGRMELTVDGKSRVLEPGMVEVLRSNVPHAARALTDCRVIDVFCPVRADWAEKMGKI